MSGFSDAVVYVGATQADLSTDKFRRFVSIARARGFPLPEDASPQAVLENLRQVRQGQPTNAAVLLFDAAEAVISSL